ncbi:MAG: RNA methyltransferase [Bacteroidota bacterium]|nr:RNA methyltransferase [Bacteroidota bacterium]
MLPINFLQSLAQLKGFDQPAFEAVHASAEQVTSIRINPQKFNSENSGWEKAGQVPWCNEGYYLTQRPSFTFDPLFHAGAYYVQEASSMFLCAVLQQTVQETKGMKVLDLCAAPGGKTTLLASYFKDGLVVSNEVIKSRANILVENVTKWGSDHVIVTNNDPKSFAALTSYFDVIIVDAPCSGSGMFRKDTQSIVEWSEENVKLCSLRQQRIVADVLPALKEGGVLIYSTCSYSVEEDESILDWLMDEQDLVSCRIAVQDDWRIVETESTRHQAYGYRFWPHRLQGEGFFIAAFVKLGNFKNEYLPSGKLSAATKQEQQFINDFFSLPLHYHLFKQKDFFRVLPQQWLPDIEKISRALYIKKAGIELGSIKGKDIIPSHEFALSLLPKEKLTTVEVSRDEALQYLRKKEIKVEGIKGWVMITYCGLPLGWAKVLPNRMNNYYPSEWRILKD